MVEKKAEEPPKPIEEAKPKVTEKKEIQAAKEVAPPPEPQPPKPDPIAEKLKQPDEPKPQTKVEPQPLPPKKPPQKQQPKFDADKIAALLDKREAQRTAAIGTEPNTTPSLGTASGMAAQLSQSEIDALRARLMALWNPPVGMQDASQTQVTIRIRFRKDGTLATGPHGHYQRKRRAIQRDARQRRSRGIRRAALYNAAPRTLRPMERNRLHLRYQADVSRYSRKVVQSRD